MDSLNIIKTLIFGHFEHLDIYRNNRCLDMIKPRKQKSAKSPKVHNI